MMTAELMGYIVGGLLSVFGLVGAVFGLTFRIVPNMYVYYKHYSAHVFDNGNKKADAGTEDYIGVVFNFGYDKGRSSLFK
jgi:hypothetical protein